MCPLSVAVKAEVFRVEVDGSLEILNSKGDVVNAKNICHDVVVLSYAF